MSAVSLLGLSLPFLWMATNLFVFAFLAASPKVPAPSAMPWWMLFVTLCGVVVWCFSFLGALFAIFDVIMGPQT